MPAQKKFQKTNLLKNFFFFFFSLAWNLSKVFGKCHEGICMRRALQKVKNDASHSHVKKSDYVCSRGDGICNTYVPVGEEIHFS